MTFIPLGGKIVGMTAIFFHRIRGGWAPNSVSCVVTPAEARELRATHEARVAKAGSPFRAYKPGEQSLYKVTGTLSELYEAFGDRALLIEDRQ